MIVSDRCEETVKTSAARFRLAPCSIDVFGQAWCWGDNGLGALGIGVPSADALQAIPVNGIGGPVFAASSISGGVYGTCAVTTTGAAQCWGYNSSGQVGDGTTTNRFGPVGVSGLGSGVTAVSTSGVHACARTTAGAVKCWGYNDRGSVGDGTTMDRSTPVDVVGLSSGVKSVSRAAC